MISKVTLYDVALLFIAVVSLASAQNKTLENKEIYFPPNDPIEQITNYGRCITPTGERALCINLEQCSYLYGLLQKRPLPDSERVFLSKSQCGYNNGNVLICCSDRHIRNQQAPMTTNTRAGGSLPQPGVCGNVISDRIYGGNVTKIDEYPWMALIEYKDGGNPAGHHCGGSLITDRYVVTAAHCVSAIPQAWSPYRVRLGEWDTSTDRDCSKDVRGYEDCSEPHIDIVIEKAIPHESYDPNSNNQFFDIALLRLQQTVGFTDFIRPICLPVQNNLRSSSFDGITMDVAGWGKTESGSNSNIKLKASVAVVPLSDCQRVYIQRNRDLQSSQICAGGQMGIDSCRGDSGGPLIALDASNKVRVYYFLAGIVSYGPTPCGLQGWPGVYTKVGDYVDWIQTTIKP